MKHYKHMIIIFALVLLTLAIGSIIGSRQLIKEKEREKDLIKNIKENKKTTFTHNGYIYVITKTTYHDVVTISDKFRSTQIHLNTCSNPRHVANKEIEPSD